VIKHVFAAGISRILVAFYVVSIASHRLGIVFSEKQLRHEQTSLPQRRPHDDRNAEGAF